MKYAKELQTVGFMKFPELIPHLENELKITINARSIQSQPQHLNMGSTARSRDRMLLLEKQQCLRHHDHSLLFSFRTDDLFNTLQDI